MDDVNGMPTPIIVPSETHVTRQEIQAKYPGSMTRVKKLIEAYEELNPDSEKITHKNDVGYIIRYELLHASSEEVNANPSLRSFLILWTKDFKKFGVSTYSGYDFRNPL